MIVGERWAFRAARFAVVGVLLPAHGVWIAPSGRPNGAVGAAARAEAAGPRRALGIESRLEHQLGGGGEASGWPKRPLARRLRRGRYGAF